MITVQFLHDSLTVNLFFLFLLSMTAVMKQKRELEKKEQELCDMRADILTAQISQHFIYNTLTTIKYLCRKDAVLAAETVDEFSEYLRGNLDSLTADKMIWFSKELDHVKNYLAIEQKRFGERVRVIYDIQEEGFMVPALTLQSIVENAVKHGISKREQGGTIYISSGRDDADYWIRVRDDGVGYQAGKKGKTKGMHVGMNNVTSRVESICGGSVQTESRPGEGTEVWIKIPREGKYKRQKHEGTDC